MKLKLLSLVFFLSVCFNCAFAQTVVNFNDPKIHYMGRIGMLKDAAELTWGASAVVINFNGTGAKATLSDNTGNDYVTVVVDDKVATTLQPGTEKKEYTLISGLPAGNISWSFLSVPNLLWAACSFTISRWMAQASCYPRQNINTG
jgi:hypothetical protein